MHPRTRTRVYYFAKIYAIILELQDANMLEYLVESIRMFYANRTLDAICEHLKRHHPPAQVMAARKIVEEEIQRIKSLKDPPGLIDPTLRGWYPGPGNEDIFWPKVKDKLMAGGWSESSISHLDTESTRIVSLLEHPGLGAFKRRGLVVGYVQSGKTANFTAVIAKAADAGYRLFIVMSGVTNKLRRQTQMRFDADLRQMLSERWIALTDEHQDFTRQHAGNVDAFLTQYAQHKTVCVVKKIPMRLKLLADWLTSARPEVLQACPVLVIDDEADEASINTARVAGMRSRANAQICRMIGLLPKVAYVGYTATPFANVFIDPSDNEDLYPRDFIIDLPRKSEYFGAERIFGRSDLSPEDSERDKTCVDVVRTIPKAEVPMLRPTRAAKAGFTVKMDSIPCLKESVRWFWLATACRRVRRGAADFHSSMLIHSSQMAAVHNAFRGPLESFRELTGEKVRKQDAATLNEFRRIWKKETERVRAEDLGLEAVAFDELLAVLPDVVSNTRVVIENYLAAQDDRLAYGSEPVTVIVVGGAILARGLTLEGLVTSHFVRSASAYDALLQMGRWFGFRDGYEDLPRIWLTDELKAHFFDLATVEEEIRRDIARYAREGLTPLDFAPRIRTHPALMITSKLKMQHAIRCSASYDEKRIQTTIFLHKDRNWLDANLAAASQLLKTVTAGGLSFAAAASGRFALEGVPVEAIRTFLNAYQTHERHEMFRRDVVGAYIDAENAVGALKEWNVVVMGHRDGALGHVDFGSGCCPNLIPRSRIKNLGGDEFANIKALMSESDVCADFEETPSEITREQMFALRNSKAAGRGLLLIYPVSKMSKAEAGSSNREDLNAAAHIIGIALVFPRTGRISGTVDYMSADLSAIEQDEPELADETVEEAEA